MITALSVICIGLGIGAWSTRRRTTSHRFLVQAFLYASFALLQYCYGIAVAATLGLILCSVWLYRGRSTRDTFYTFAHEHILFLIGLVLASLWVLPHLKQHHSLPDMLSLTRICFAVYTALRLIEACLHRWLAYTIPRRTAFIQTWYYSLFFWILAAYGVEVLLLTACMLSWCGLVYSTLFRSTPGTALARDNITMITFFWLVRSFFFQPFLVPTGSLEPTIAPGDFVLVKQYAYGLRFPVWGFKLWPMGSPERGDIAVFRYPPQPDILYVKRVIGLPGDHIRYSHDQLTINGVPVAQQCTHTEHTTLDQPRNVLRCHEDLPGAPHDIYLSHQDPHRFKTWEWKIPEGQYLMLGDNRQGSLDSRFWGYVDERLLVGKVEWVLFSFDTHALPRIHIRPERMLSSVYASD